MNADKWQRAKEIFNSAIDLAPELRGGYVAEECNGDEALRRQVEGLLNSYDTDFLETAETYRGEARRLSSGDSLGRYEIADLLGIGGMGEVYLARDPSLGRKVAIKILNRKYEAHESNIQRFVQEAKAASALNHPNILTVYEIGETKTSHYIVSEFIEGKTLREVLDSGELQLSNVLDIAVQTASALSAAHAARIIHRDIKPENLMLRNDGYIKVLDFGLAKLLPERTSFIGLDEETIEQNRTAKGLIMGTVSYMSPEQARADAVDERTDIFSLGVVIYEMISGRTPFAGESMSETFANLINKEPELLSRLTSGVPDELERIVSKMLHKVPDGRYQTMKGLLADLKELKDRTTFEAKLDRTSSPGTDADTAVMARTTGDVAQSTDETQNEGLPWYLRPVSIAFLAVVLVGALLVGLYWRSTATVQPQIKSLAVLPLKSLDAGENYFGFGIADAVIRRISQTGALTVRPTSAVKRYLTEDVDALAAAQQLSVDAVLEGTVQRVGDTLRVTVNLLRSSDGASLWTEKYETQATDIFAVQDKVAQQVAARLQLQLDPAQQTRLAKRTTSDPVAYDYYVKAVYAFNQRRFDKLAREQIDTTIDLLKRAIDKDPQYALAHAKLAHAYAWKGLFVDVDDQPRLLAFADEEIVKADALDPQLAETHLARFRIMFSEPGGWRIEDAVKEILTAQHIDPNVGHEEAADMYLHIGLEDLMDREIRKAQEIDPTSEWVKLQMMIFYVVLNRYDDYLKVKNEYFPEEPIQAGYYLVRGDLAKAREILEEEEKKDPRGADPALKAMLLGLEGRKRESEALVPEMVKGTKRMNPSYHHVTYDAACIYAINGNISEAMKWLRETATKGNPSYTLFTRDPFLDNIRNSPEFVQLMAELKPQYDRYRNEFQ